VWEGSINLVLAGAAVVGGIVATVFGFTALFILMTGMATGGFVVSTFLMERNIWSELREIIRKRKALHV
jgi:hypothetical protein